MLRAAHLDVAQVYGELPDVARIWHALRVGQTSRSARDLQIPPNVEAILLDGPANGIACDWNFARALSETDKKIVLAGGLNASNVAQAVRSRSLGASTPARLESAPAGSRKSWQFVKAARGTMIPSQPDSTGHRSLRRLRARSADGPTPGWAGLSRGIVGSLSQTRRSLTHARPPHRSSPPARRNSGGAKFIQARGPAHRRTRSTLPDDSPAPHEPKRIIAETGAGRRVATAPCARYSAWNAWLHGRGRAPAR